MALGAAEALAARKLTGKVAIVGIDATWEAVRAVQAGALAGDIAMYPEQLGSRSVEAAIKAARGQPFRNELIRMRLWLPRRTRRHSCVKTAYNS